MQEPNTALLFVWGTKAPWPKYVENYKGPCVIFIHPEDFNDKVTEARLEGGWNLQEDRTNLGILTFMKS